MSPQSSNEPLLIITLAIDLTAIVSALVLYGLSFLFEYGAWLQKEREAIM